MDDRPQTEVPDAAKTAAAGLKARAEQVAAASWTAGVSAFFALGSARHQSELAGGFWSCGSRYDGSGGLFLDTPQGLTHYVKRTTCAAPRDGPSRKPPSKPLPTLAAFSN